MREALKAWPQLSDFPGRTLKATLSSVCCFGYKVVGSSETRVLSLWDYPSWQSDVNDDRRLVRDAARVIRTADVIVFQNGKRFDWPFLQTRLLKNKLTPLPKILSIDTKNEAKKHLLSFSNSLKYLAAQFTDQEKMENDGWDLWVRVHSRDAEAQDTMAAYCAQDIIATEALFEALKPYMTTLPNMNQFSLEGDLCPNCGMASLKKRGTSLKKEQTMQRFQCMSCAAWSQQPKRGAPRGQST